MRCQNQVVLTSYIIGDNPEKIVNIYQQFDLTNKNNWKNGLVMDNNEMKNGKGEDIFVYFVIQGFY